MPRSLSLGLIVSPMVPSIPRGRERRRSGNLAISRSKKRVCRGNQKESCGVAEPSVTLYASRFVSDYSVEQFKDRLKKVGIYAFSCYKIYKVGLPYCSFKFSVIQAALDSCFNPSIWPQHVFVTEWKDQSRFRILDVTNNMNITSASSKVGTDTNSSNVNVRHVSGDAARDRNS